MDQVRSGQRLPDPARVLRGEVSRLRRSLERVEAALEQLPAREPSPVGPRTRPDRYFRLLVDVYEHGRHGVAQASFVQLGRRRGYDARGLGGFFLGGRAPLRRRDARVQLTGEGQRLVADYLALA